MIAEIDDWTLTRFQWASDWLHSITGFDSIEQSRFCAGITAAMFLAMVVADANLRRRFDWVGSLIMLERLQRAFFERVIDSQSRSESRRGLRNSLRISAGHQFERLFFLALLAPIIALGIWTSFPGFIYPSMAVISRGFSEFLEACDVQEPRMGRIREALTELSKALTRRPVRVSS